MNKKIMFNSYCSIEEKSEIIYFNNLKKRTVTKIKNNKLIYLITSIVKLS